MVNKGKQIIFLVITGIFAQVNQDSVSTPDSYEDINNANNRVYLSETSFNGHYDNPLELLRGRLPGLLISRPGSDPNRQFDVRLREFIPCLTMNSRCM